MSQHLESTLLFCITAWSLDYNKAACFHHGMLADGRIKKTYEGFNHLWIGLTGSVQISQSDIPHVAASQKTCDAAAENTKWREGRDVLSDDPLVWRTKGKTRPLLTGGYVDFCVFKKKKKVPSLGFCTE